MQYSIVNYSEVSKTSDFRIDADYWHPMFIKNATLVPHNLKISDFVESDILNIKTSPVNRDFNYLEISRISLNSCEYETTKIRYGEEPDRAHYILKKGDITVSTVRPNRNAIAFIEENGIIGSSGLSVLRPKNIEAEYLFAFCKTDYFVKCLIRANKATMYPAVSDNDVLNTYLFVPSKSLKLLIVKIVKDSFSCISKSKKAYTQAENTLLSELGLTDWQPKHQLTFIKQYSDIKESERMDADYFQPKYEEIVNAIKSYSGGWDTLGNLVSIKKCIEVGSNMYLDEGIPFVRVSNLSLFEITKEKYIAKKLYIEIKEHQPEKGEILFSKDGTPGIAYHLNESPEKMIPSGGILRLKNITDKINNEYLTLVLNSILTKEQVNRDVGGSVILHWRPAQVKGTLIPILPKNIQTKIQQKVIQSLALRKQSKHLLECAKRAVEIAIEEDEKAALTWLKKETQE